MNPKNLNVKHINIRQSISLLLLKLVSLEIAAALTVLLFFQSFSLMNLNIWELLLSQQVLFPLYILLVLLKTALTIYLILQWLNSYYEITSTHIYHRRGVIFKKEEQYRLVEVTLIETQQSLWGKIFNYGSIALYRRVRSKIMDLNYLHNPLRYSKILSELVPNSNEVREIVREGLREKNIFDE